MENLSRYEAQGMQANVPPDFVARMREDWRMARAAHSDLQIMGMPRVNLMLVGAAGPILGVLDLLHKTCAQPITTWREGQPLALPPPGGARTLILQEIGELAIDDQRRLAEWLESTGGRTQVISTSSASILTSVQSGEFLDTLYYRLNMVYIDVSE